MDRINGTNSQLHFSCNLTDDETKLLKTTFFVRKHQWKYIVFSCYIVGLRETSDSQSSYCFFGQNFRDFSHVRWIILFCVRWDWYKMTTQWRIQDFPEEGAPTTLADLRGAPGTRDPPRGPNSFILMQLSVKIGQNSRLAPPHGGLAPPSGKSWMRHWTTMVWLWPYYFGKFSPKLHEIEENLDPEGWCIPDTPW